MFLSPRGVLDLLATKELAEVQVVQAHKGRRGYRDPKVWLDRQVRSEHLATQEQQ